MSLADIAEVLAVIAYPLTIIGGLIGAAVFQTRREER